jgi:bifunctional non-homologous end joining protein LigD
MPEVGAITHPDKVLFPDDGITKGALADYYAWIAPLMLPHLRGRPVTMERFPAGIGAKGFIQKDAARGAPPWLELAVVPKHGGTVSHPLIGDARALAWMANQNCVTPHVWNRRVPHLDRPDLCVFDLDPSRDEPDVLRDVALALRDLLAELGLPSWVKTSGSKGYHIVVPLDGAADVGAVARFADGVGAALVARRPDQVTQELAKADRGGRMLIDTGRNGYSATFAAPYAVRPLRGAPVSAPCTWDELARGEAPPRAFTLANLRARVDAIGDPWAELHARPSSLP